MEYKRRVDKNLIPICNIMGVNIAAINMEWLVDYLEKNISEIKGDYICVSNVHTTVTSYEDAAYCAIQNGGLMAIPDGGPLSTVGQKRGHKNMERTTGPSLMGEIFKISAKKGYRHYFYGSKEETLELLYQKLTNNYPGIQIAGMYSPPFRPMTEEEDKAIIERINETNPDFVWVGLGAPKQEKWMAAHQGKIDGLMLGVGAGFDYYAENIKRAPMWMQKRRKGKHGIVSSIWIFCFGQALSITMENILSALHSSERTITIIATISPWTMGSVLFRYMSASTSTCAKNTGKRKQSGSIRNR